MKLFRENNEFSPGKMEGDKRLASDFRGIPEVGPVSQK